MPEAVLFDLDDTLISAYRNPQAAWTAIAAELGPAYGDIPSALVAQTIMDRVNRFFAWPANRKLWRLDPVETRRSVVLSAFEQLYEEGLDLPDPLALAMADRYETYRDENMHLLPDAHEVLDRLRAEGLRLALLTNGSSRVQRRKIERFDLERRFDHIQIEEEAGIGKPSRRAYRRALKAIAARPEASMMVGDDLEMDILPSRRLGLSAVWLNPEGPVESAAPIPTGTYILDRLARVPEIVGLTRGQGG